MDKDITMLYDLLEEYAYPVTDLKNPSPDFMIKFSLHFLAQHSIDGKAIQKETEEQRNTLTFPELYSDMVASVNLHMVMAKLGELIFVKDLYITDFLSPGAKRTRRIVSTFLNFALYAYNKLEELNEPLNAIFSRSNTYKTHLEKKERLEDLRVETVLQNSKKKALRDQKLAIKKKCMEQIAYTKNDVNVALQELRTAEEQAQTVLDRTMLLRQEVLKERAATAKLESLVVKSPEEYRVKLISLQQKHAEKTAAKAEMYQKMQDKLRLIARFEKIEEVVHRQHEKFPQLQITYQRFNAANKQTEKLLRDLNEIITENEKLKEIADPNIINTEESKLAEIDRNWKMRLAPVYKIRDDLRCKEREVIEQLEDARICCFEMNREKAEVCAMIADAESKTSDFLKACKELHDKEIMKDVNVERFWDNECKIDQSKF